MGRSITHTLLMHPQVPHRLYSAAGDGFIYQGRGYNESYDGGQTWQHPAEGLEHHYLWGAAVDPTDPDTIIVSAAQSPDLATLLRGKCPVVHLSQDLWSAVAQG